MILFIDDEARLMDSYYNYLEIEMEPYGQEVRFISDVDEALNYFENRHAEIDLVILDVMMPFGKSFSASRSNSGLATGLLFYKRIRKLTPSLPVLIFTNYYEDGLEKLFANDSKCQLLQKSDYLLEDFVFEVKKSLSLC